MCLPSSFMHKALRHIFSLSKHFFHSQMVVIFISIISCDKFNFGSPYTQCCLSFWKHFYVTDRADNISKVKPMVWVVAIFSSVLWMFHTCRVLTHNEVSNTTIRPGRNLPKGLCRSSSKSWWWPNWNNGGVWIQKTFLKVYLNLSESRSQRNICNGLTLQMN